MIILTDSACLVLLNLLLLYLFNQIQSQHFHFAYDVFRHLTTRRIRFFVNLFLCKAATYFSKKGLTSAQLFGKISTCSEHKTLRTKRLMWHRWQRTSLVVRRSRVRVPSSALRETSGNISDTDITGGFWYSEKLPILLMIQ